MISAVTAVPGSKQQGQDCARAVRFFQDKLDFTISPVTLGKTIKTGEPLQIIDLRSKEYFQAGHINGAINWQLDELAQNLMLLDLEITTVVYCYDSVCNLGAKAAIMLASSGYKVKELDGGYKEWKNHLNFDKNSPPPESWG